MTTKRLKIALFKHVPMGFTSVFSAGEDGRERELPDYCRLSEWIELDFPLLPDNDMKARKQREVELVRTRLQNQLAALDKEDAK